MNAEPIAVALLTLGGLFLASLAADVLGRRLHLPRVTLLVGVGTAAGPLGLDLLPDASRQWFPFVADLALVMVAFLLGGELTAPVLRAHGRAVLVISLAVVAATAAIVAAGLLLLGWPLALALLLGAVATSTDPAAVSDVAREADARGPLSRILLGVVAVDDAWGIAAMSIALACVLGLGDPVAAGALVLEGLRDLGGAVLVGVVLGVPLALLSGRVRAGEPTLAEALGGVLLCGGIALHLEVSFLLAAMTMGLVVANLARHHRRPFRAIEGIEWPFMALFFVLSGASLDAAALAPALGLTAAYVALRVLGRIAGGWLAARLAGGVPSGARLGLGLLPQSGLAIGMALVASQRVPAFGGPLLAATVAATLLFELFGPLLTRRALERAGETTPP
jgi:Kef-type K+ transport system membrane component KefB